MLNIPLSLYVHFPWCVRKCPYCDFNSHALRGALSPETLPEEAYVDALIRDLDFELLTRETRALVSIFFGGGTPSLFSGKSIGRLLEAVRARMPFAAGIEITMEANPGTVDAAHFAAYRNAGVNRLSIGVQSLNDQHLKALGRIHGANDARRAVEVARAAGFDNINLDLMYALPQQTLAEAESDIRAACALSPEHLSYYHLTLEPNTEFHAHPPALPDSDSAWDMQEQGVAIMAGLGYTQYEVSAYARKAALTPPPAPPAALPSPALRERDASPQPSAAQYQCRHNLNYWEFGDYLGIGAGAHGKRTRSGGIERRARHKLPRKYLEHAGTFAALQEEKVLGVEDLPFEFAINALRLNAGFYLKDFEARTGQPATLLDTPLLEAKRQGLLEQQGDLIQPTASGSAFLNKLTALFLP